MRVDLSNFFQRPNRTIHEKKISKGVSETILPEKGQRIEGKILDILQNRLTIQLADGQQVTAKMLETLPLSIGDQLFFDVLESSLDQIVLKPTHEEQGEEQSTHDMLRRIGIEPTTTKINIVKALVERNMPIHKETVQQIERYIHRFPEAKLETLLFLTKNNILVSEETIQYGEQLIKGQENLSKEMVSLGRMLSTGIKNPEIRGALEALSISYGEHSEKKEIILSNIGLKTALSILTSIEQPADGNVRVALKENISANGAPNLNLLEQSNITQDGKGVQSSSMQVVSSNYTELSPEVNRSFEETIHRFVVPTLEPEQQKVLAEALLSFKNIMSLEELNSFFETLTLDGKTKTYIKEATAERLIEQALNQNLLLGREALEDNGQLSKHFQKVYVHLKEIIEHVSQQENGGQTEEVLKTAQQIRTGIETMHQLQQNYQFVHLPLMLNQQQVNSQLYVMNRKKQQKSADEKITALLSLDYRNLGHLDVYVTKQMKNIELTFYVEDESTEVFLQENMVQLQQQLIQKSFNIMGLGVRLHDTSLQEIQTFFEQKNPSDTPKRFTFDVRA